MPNFQTIKNFQKALNDINIMNLQIVLNTTTKTYLNQATNKEYLLKFSYLKNPKIENVKPKKILWSSIRLCHLKLEYPPLGLWWRLGSELHDIYNFTPTQLQTKHSAV